MRSLNEIENYVAELERNIERVRADVADCAARVIEQPI